MKRAKLVVLPLVIIAAGAISAVALIYSREKPETRVPEASVPVVRVLRVRLEDRQLTVSSQGTVSPRTESVLIPEVSGLVVEVAPSFVSGGFFEAGDVLLRIDSGDYRQGAAQARAVVAQAELRLAREQAEADVARREWQQLDGGEAPPLTSRELQVADASAALDAARAALDKAERDVERTSIRAPYAGRLRDKQVDVGQFVSRGTPLATIYSVDHAEIRLPLPDYELAFLDLPQNYRGEAGRSGPEVMLHAGFAGKIHEWRGRIVRTAGEIDPRSRMVHAIASVRDPYARGDDPERPPLAAGMYVEAEILGRKVRDVAVIPRSALRDDGRVLVVDDDSRLRFREVEILRRSGDEIVVGSGLAEGERICLTPLHAVTDGMRVQAAEGA